MPARPSRDLNQFLHRRQADWHRLESLLTRVEEKGLRVLSGPEVTEFGRLYRRASSDLVAARTRTANAAVLDYLNDLVARAYAQVYGSRGRVRFNQDMVRAAIAEFPRLVRRHSTPMLLAFLLMLVSSAAGWILSRVDPAAAYHFLPAELVRQIPTMREVWKTRTGHSIEVNGMAFESAFIMTHNIGIGVTAFGGGLFAGFPTLLVLVQTGVMVGVLGEGMSGSDTAVTFWSLILPHGFLELSAIGILGGAGFLLASGLLFPGRRPRLEALQERGHDAVRLALGGGVMLVLAGLIEGFVTPPAWVPPLAKIAFAFCTLAAEIAYFLLLGREAKE